MNPSFRRLVVPVSVAAVVFAGVPAVSSAAPDPTTGMELNVSDDQFVATKVIYDPAAGTNEGAAALCELRGRMWDENPPFVTDGVEGTTLQEVARNLGMTTKEQYQNGFGIDEILNWAAIQRALESSVIYEHVRPDGADSWSVVPGFPNFSGESLASSRPSLHDTILQDWGYGELDGLKRSGGKQDQAGHLHMMIDPRNRAYGFGAVKVPGTTWSNYYASFSSTNQVTTAAHSPAGRQTAVIHRAAMNGEKPTGIIPSVDQLPGSNVGNLASVSSLSSSIGGSSNGGPLGIVF